MLMGILARLRKVVQPLRREVEDEEDEEEVKMDRLLTGAEIPDFGEVITREDAQMTSPITDGAKNEGGDDVEAGAEIKKKHKKRSSALEELGEDSAVESTPAKPREKKNKKKRKKRKGHDEFDDLFGSLL
jgi:hypothetical protein